MIPLVPLRRRFLQQAVSRSGRRIAVRVAALAILALAPACDKVPLIAPTGSTITLYVSSTTVPLNGSADVTAVVTESAGTPVHNGTHVTFATNLGSIEPSEAQTQGGKVTVRFSAGTRSGEAEISAVSGSASTEQPVTVKVGAAAVARIVLTANPVTVPASGGEVQIAVLVLDSAGNTLPGVPVILATTGGALGSPALVTDQAGEARTTLSTSRAATVTATAGPVTTSTSGSSAISASVSIEVAAAPAVTLTPPSSLVAGVAGTFTVSVTPGTDSTTIRRVTVYFGDGTSVDLGNLSGSTTLSKKYSTAGTYEVTAVAVDSFGQRAERTAIVTVTPAAVLEVVLSASPASPKVNTVTTFTATVSVSGGGTVPAIKQYIWDFGDGETQTSSSKQATHIYTRTGSWVVTLTVVPVEGASATGRIDIIIGS